MTLRGAFALLCCCALAGAANTTSMQIGTWNMRTTDLFTNILSGDFTLPQHVALTRADGSTVDADNARGNFKRKLIDLRGHVVLHDQSGAMGSRIGLKPSSKRAAPAKLVCERLQIDERAARYVATGDVKYSQGNSVMTADRVVLDNGKHKVHLSGHVRVTQ